MKDIAAFIRQRRKSLKKTQDEVAKALGVSSVAVGNWERGANKPDGENLLNLASILKCSPDDLVSTQSPRRSQAAIKADQIRQAYLSGSPELQAVVERILNIVDDSQS